MIYIILPVRNEAKTIDKTIEHLYDYLNNAEMPCEIIFVDDHSTDGTTNKLLNPKHIGISVISNTGRGKGAALRSGFEKIVFGKEHHLQMADQVIFLDGDGQIEPYDIHTGLKMMERYCCSVAIGSKRHPFSIVKRPLLREVVSFCYNMIIKTFFGLRLDDTQCGLKIFRLHALLCVMHLVKTDNFAFDLELLLALKENNYRIVDFPIHLRKQQNKGSVSWKNMWTTFVSTVDIFKKYKKRFYSR